MPSSRADKLINPLIIGVFGLGSLAYLSLIMDFASPESFYTLDDPYIHLALAEMLVQGQFGINAGETSSPSSSVLWPVLLAPAAATEFLVYLPLAINLLAFLASCHLILWLVDRHLLDRHLLDRHPVERSATPALTLKCFLIFVLVCLNAWGVIFTGMEHSLHILTSIATAVLLISRTHRAWLVVLLILGPLIRFEGLAVSLVGLGVLLHERDTTRVVVVVLALGAVLGLYAGLLAQLGLPVLPSSVLVHSKLSSSLIEGGGLLATVETLADDIHANLRAPSFPIFGALAALLVYKLLTADGRARILAALALLFFALHLAVGRSGAYYRYEVYALCFAFTLCIGLYRAELRALPARIPALCALVVFILALSLRLGPWVALSTPQAASNIYRQQYQMHRFVTECWQAPVAVNDLGWVAFDNPYYVLDLWGLGSEAARIARRNPEASGWPGALLADKDVEAVMIYDPWFEGYIPESWTKVGTLGLGERRLTPSHDKVAFYATSAEAAAKVRACLDQIRATAPSRVAIELF